MEYYPLEGFDDLIERNGIDKYHEKFLLDAQMLDAVFLNQEKTEFSFHEIS